MQYFILNVVERDGLPKVSEDVFPAIDHDNTTRPTYRRELWKLFAKNNPELARRIREKIIDTSGENVEIRGEQIELVLFVYDALRRQADADALKQGHPEATETDDQAPAA